MKYWELTAKRKKAQGQVPEVIAFDLLAFGAPPELVVVALYAAWSDTGDPTPPFFAWQDLVKSVMEEHGVGWRVGPERWGLL